MTDESYLRPILRVRDVEASSAYYCEQLGFTRAWSFPGEKPIVAQVGRHGLDVILDAGSSMPRPATPSVLSLSLQRSESLGAVYQELVERGAKITAPPFEVVWQKGLYEFDVEDLDGNLLVFWGDAPS